MSTMWWVTLARSAGDGLAVPMSIPRYTCIESTESTDPPRSAASRRAISLFPEAVGPRTASRRVRRPSGQPGGAAPPSSRLRRGTSRRPPGPRRGPICRFGHVSSAISGSLRDGPSVSTSNTRPTCSWFRSSEIPPCKSASRSNLSCATSCGTASLGHGCGRRPWSRREEEHERLVVSRLVTTSSVREKSPSVSPGKPTMMSLETASPGMVRLANSSLSR